MRLLTARTVEEFAREHPDAAQALSDWCATVGAARWQDADHMRRAVGSSVRPIGQGRAVFKILGNAYRIVCEIRYADAEGRHNGIVSVQFLGTHAEYDKIDAATVSWSTR